MRLSFNRRSPIGLDIAARSIGAVQLVEVAGGWRIEAGAVLARGQHAAKPGANAKASGQASGTGNQDLSSEELIEIVGVLDRQGFVGNRVVVAAPEGAKFSATMELPPRSSGAPIEALAGQELARSAKRDIASIEVGMWDVPAPARSGSSDGSGGATHLLAVGLAHADADAMIEAIEGAGLVVEALECRCCAMARACSGLLGVGGPGSGGAAANHVSAILDLSDACASIAVMHSGTVAYDRPVLETGLARLREQLQLELRADAEAVDYLLDAMNRGAGVEGGSAGVNVGGGIEGGVAADLPEHSVHTASKLMNEYLAMVVQELRSVMAYAIHRYPGAIGPVLLMGPGAVLGGLREKIRSELDLETRVITPRDVASCGPELEAIAADASLTTAIGLAMRPVRATSRRAA